MTEQEQQIIERIARLESKMEEIQHDVRCLENKLDGYLDNRIRTNIDAYIGRIFISALLSSGAVSALIAWLIGR